MPGLSSPEDILATELKEIYSAERQLSRAIPRLTKKISSDRLRQMLDKRREQGAALIEELDDTLEEMDVSKGRPKNIAAEGLIDDTNHHIEEIDDEKLLDPVLLASIQKIEHYCIASWGSAAAMGRLLGQKKVVKTMEQVLNEGKRFDEEMTKLAEEEVNPAMLADDEGEEDEGEDQEAQDEEKSSSSSQGRRRKSKSN